MTQVTIRKVDESLVAKAKASAAVEGVSMNTILRDAMKRGLGIIDAPKTNGLERFSGDSPDDFGNEWAENMKVFDQIDPEMWK